MKQLSLLLPALLFFLSAQAEPIEIPYESIGGKMRVAVEINGIPEFLIFDTGGQTTLTGALARQLGLPPAGVRSVTDVNSVTAEYPMALVERLSFPGSEQGILQVQALIVESDIYTCYGAGGMIGNDILRHFRMTIDSRESLITLDRTEAPPVIGLRHMSLFVEDNRTMPVFGISLSDGNVLNVLLDTGADTFLTLSEQDFHRLAGGSSFDILARGIGAGITGIGSVSEQSEIFRVRFS
ncbi:MAG: hypothetical protein LUD68_05775, partial [Rikenellaceae bacterium]|nr:hypothetical protein [Rikenellaceae bacterium]